MSASRHVGAAGAVVLAAFVHAQSETADAPAFDPGALQTVSGRILDVSCGEPMDGRAEVVEIVLDTGAEPLAVRLGPVWFLERQDVTLAEGDWIEVTGALTGSAEGPLLLAAEIRFVAGVLGLRDACGAPKWRAWSEAAPRPRSGLRRGMTVLPPPRPRWWRPRDMLRSLGRAPFALVTPEWVAAHRADPDVRILDVRRHTRDYLANHVPGAVHLPAAALRGPRAGVPVELVPPDALASIFTEAGVTSEHLVVVYADGKDVVDATLVAYALDRLGHRGVRLMDGGYAEYRDHLPTDRAYPRYPPGAMSPGLRRDILVTVDDLRSVVPGVAPVVAPSADPAPGVTIIDVRSAADYRGDDDVWIRNGHIPGAINIDWTQLVEEDNLHRLRPAEELRALFVRHGVRPDQQIIVYCGTGRQASLAYGVLRYVLGFPKVRLYEGSWTEYAARVEMPVATGT